MTYIDQFDHQGCNKINISSIDILPWGIMSGILPTGAILTGYILTKIKAGMKYDNEK